MLSEPKLEQRAAQPYVAIRRQVTMQELGTVLPPLHDDVMRWLQSKDIASTDAPFFRYLVMDMDKNQFDVEVGWPIATPVTGEGDIIGGALPAGRYGVILNTGPFSDLVGAHYALLEWGKKHNISWQTSDQDRAWGARLEFYITDPAEEPDPQKWKTEVAFLAADA